MTPPPNQLWGQFMHFKTMVLKKIKQPALIYNHRCRNFLKNRRITTPKIASSLVWFSHENSRVFN
jgi:hypothetical protein